MDFFLPLVNAGKKFVFFFLALVNVGEYFVGYCLAISESWRIFCW